MRRLHTRLTAVLLAAATLAAGCPDAEPQPQPTNTPVVDDGLSAMARSTRGKLLWRRGEALARGLAAALLVPQDDLCKELGRFDCVDLAHQGPLGGNDSFVRGQYDPLPEPGATTVVAFDRLVLTACTRAVETDLRRPGRALFRGHELTDTPLDPSDPDAIESARYLGTLLIERVHGRAPREAELAALTDLLTDDEGRGVSGRDYAILACFAVAATTETLFD